MHIKDLYGLNVVEMPVVLKMPVVFKPKDVWGMFVDLLGITYRLRVIRWYKRQLPAKKGLQNMFSFVLREQ